MSTSLESALPTLGQEVPLGRVDKALKELWGADEARTKASLMNFAIYNEDPSSLEKNTSLLAEITQEQACRGLLILNLPDAEKPRARAWITAHCQLYGGTKSVCSEQVSFVLEGGNGNQVRNIVFAHLDSDLPLVFWWQGDLTDHFDERLYSVIDLLFVDSSSWSNPAQGFKNLQNAQTETSTRFHVYDLSWLRSHYVRTALASCFQDPLALAELPKLKTLRIDHAPGHRLASLLLVAWVAVRLKADVTVDAKGIQLVLKEGQKVTVEISEVGGIEAVQKVELISENGIFTVSRECGSSYVCASVQLQDHAHEQILPADLPTDAALIVNLLSRLGRKSLYMQMVPMLCKML